MLRNFIRNASQSAMQQKSLRTPIPVFGVEGSYVQALYSAASQKKELDGVEKCFKDLQKVLKKPVIKDFIATSMISRNAKGKLLKDIGVSAGIPSTASNFLGLLAENGRLKLLRRIIPIFLEVMTAHRGEAVCEVIVAEPLENSERAALMAVLKKFIKGGKKIQLHENVDDSVIGGMVVLIEDKHIDLCIARKILLYSKMLKKSVL